MTYVPVIYVLTIHAKITHTMAAAHSLKMLVVEDNEDFTELIQTLLYQMNYRQVVSANSYHQAMSLLDTQVFDIFLIDIGLGAGRSGIAFAEEIRQRGIRAPILYLTADYTEAAYNAAKHTHPSSFLNKEISRLKLLQAIDLAVTANNNSHTTSAGSQTAAQIADNNLFFKVGDIFKSLKIGEVAFFYSDHKMSFAKVNQRSYPTNIQLKVLSDQLGVHGFFRVHKSYLVNLKHIESINPSEAIITIQGEEIPIGVTYKKSFFEAIRLLK